MTRDLNCQRESSKTFDLMSLGVVFAVQLYKQSILSSSVPVDCHVAIKSYLAKCVVRLGNIPLYMPNSYYNQRCIYIHRLRDVPCF